MKGKQFRCPSCAATLEVENQFSKVVICGYCNQTSFVKTGTLEPSGKSQVLTESYSLFSVGSTGKFRGDGFKVLGRLRYRYEGGFWDEWFIRLNDKRFIFLQEDEGSFITFEKQSLTVAVPCFDEIQVGTTFNLGEQPFFVTEKIIATIIGGEGELFFKTTPGEQVCCVDGNSLGKILALEITSSEIELCEGSGVNIDDFVFY